MPDPIRARPVLSGEHRRAQRVRKSCETPATPEGVNQRPQHEGTHLSALAVVGAVVFASEGRPVLAVLSVVPGYFVVAYVLILVSTFLPGAERSGSTRRGQPLCPAPARTGTRARRAAFPAYLGSLYETLCSGTGSWPGPGAGDLVFRFVTLPPCRYALGTRYLKGFVLLGRTAHPRL